jgi:hypothetical protein
VSDSKGGAHEMMYIFSGTLLWDPEGCLFIECLKYMRRRAQGTGISPLGGHVGELGRVLVCRDLCELWRRASVSMGAAQATVGRVCSTGTLRNRGKEAQGGISVKGT